MTTALRPTSPLVVAAWVRLVVPDVGGVGRRLPATTPGMRAGGFVRVQVVGGATGAYVPLHEPVAICECWWPPADDRQLPPWNHAAQLAQQLVDASQPGSGFQQRQVDLTQFGAGYGKAHVRTVTALDEPQEVLDDPSHFGRSDVRLQLTWTAA